MRILQKTENERKKMHLHLTFDDFPVLICSLTLAVCLFVCLFVEARTFRCRLRSKELKDK